MAVVGPVIARMRAAAPRELAWDYLADSELRATWWPDSEFDVRFGGAVSERWSDGGDGPNPGESGAVRNAVGTIDVLIAGHALGFRWRDGADDHETAVLITLRSHEHETEIMVTETGFGVFADAHERTADATQSWIDLLTDLAGELRHAAPEAPEVEAADVEGADAEDAEAGDTAVEDAEAEGTDLEDADLEDADLDNADLDNADVDYADDETGEHTEDIATDLGADAAYAADAAEAAEASEPDAR